VEFAGAYYQVMARGNRRGANLVEGMKWLQNTVTRRFNVWHRESDP